MTLLSSKPVSWSYSVTIFGTEMLSSVFSFYYVKLFLQVYRTSEVAFVQAQIILMTWNVLNDPSGYFHSTSKANCCSCRHSCVSYGFWALAFLLPRFPWKHYSEGAWLSGLQLMMRQILTQKNFRFLLMMNFFHVFHLTFLRNFMLISSEGLIPREVLPSSIRSVVYGAGFICLQCLVPSSQAWLKKCGHYKIILISFYLEGTASIVMLLLGQRRHYFLALYLTIVM